MDRDRRQERMKVSPKKRREIAAMGGHACRAALTPEERSEAASKAARARWAKVRAEADGDGAAA